MTITHKEAQNLGTFTKAVPVFTFTTLDMAIVAGLIIAATVVFALTVPASFERVLLANQETAQW